MAEGREFSLVQFSRMSRRMVRMMEKSRARRTLNDTPLPKVNWYLSHVCFILFSTFSLYLICFSPLHVWNFQNYFLHAGIFLAVFLFTKIPKKIMSFKILWKIIWTSFRAKIWPSTPWSFSIWPLELNGKREAAAGPPGGPPNPGNYCEGPTCSNGHLTIVAGLSSRAFAHFPLNRGQEGCWALSCSHTHSHFLSHSLLGFSLDFGWSLISRKLSLSFLYCKITYTLGGTTFR